MSFVKRISVILLAVAAVLPASAQFSIGPRVGVNLNSVHYSEEAVNDILNTDNHTGYNAGIQAELMLPVINLGLDASVMYVHRGGSDLKDITSLKTIDTSADFIEIPVNLKYKLNLPVVGKLLAPYIFTGPSFAFRLSEVEEFYNDNKCDISWNIGAGLELFNHLQIGASYGFGISETVDVVNKYIPSDVDVTLPEEAGVGKTNCWTITAAWLF